MLKRPKTILTSRLILKELEDKDEESLLNIVLEKEVNITYMFPDLNTKEERKTFFEKLKKLTSSDRFVYGIFLQDQVIGFLNEVYKEEDSIEIGYFINKEYWGNGYATEAFEATINELFKMGYQEVEAGFFEGNIASKRVMEKCGLKKCDKKEEIEYRGKTHKVIYYSIKKEA